MTLDMEKFASRIRMHSMGRMYDRLTILVISSNDVMKAVLPVLMCHATTECDV